jgi:hypothetical protein
MNENGYYSQFELIFEFSHDVFQNLIYHLEFLNTSLPVTQIYKAILVSIHYKEFLFPHPLNLLLIHKLKKTRAT